MSLLLEALRRAERQSLEDRDDAQPRAQQAVRSEARNDATLAGFTLELEPAPAAIACDEPPQEPSPAPNAVDVGARDAKRSSPFHLALGLLIMFAIAAAGYLWYQLQPAPRLAGGGVAQPSPVKTVAVAQSEPAPLAIPGLPIGAPVRLTESTAADAGAVLAAVKPTASSPAQELPARIAQPHPGIALLAPREVIQIHPQVEAGYAALRHGDFDAARAAYQQVLREEPGNADAILGMAALETHAGRIDPAQAYYVRRLEASPRDVYAQAGLLALRAERVDPLQAERALRSLLAADPDAIPLNVLLGNRLARQGRWAEAQQAYLLALRGEPDNPDIAFNLAVSLDQLQQDAEAMAYYGRALALAERRVAGFSTETARRRLAQLSR